MNIFELSKLDRKIPIEEKAVFFDKIEMNWRRYFDDALGGSVQIEESQWIKIRSFFALAWDNSEPNKRNLEQWGVGAFGQRFCSLVTNRQLVDKEMLFNSNLHLKKLVSVAGALAYLEGFDCATDEKLVSILSEFGWGK